jgi:uncharacterized membrane protein YbaN (DUF454 family)
MPVLSTTSRLLLLVLGWILLLIGFLGLFLPGLQGILTLILGAAVLSLVSHTMLRLLRYLFRPWPNGWRRLLRMRRRVQRWLASR